MQYLHEQGCPWDARVCSDAASNGHLDCLCYARSNGCKWDKETCNKAAEGGIYFNDPALGIDWKIDINDAIISDKDQKQPLFKDAVNSFE